MTSGRAQPGVLIADDEAPARARLRGLLAELDAWQVVGEAASGAEVLAFCEEQRPDAVLLDIRMPGMDGIEVARHLARLDAPPAVVFTTAYDEYAVDAFETHAVGYLLKPVRRERLYGALAHAVRISRLQLEELARNRPELAGRTHIPVTRAGRVKLVPVDGIRSFHADQKYVRMVHADGDDLVDESLKQLQREFSADFVRIHRNSLVRVSQIRSLEKDVQGQPVVFLHGRDTALPVSRRHLPLLRQRLR